MEFACLAEDSSKHYDQSSRLNEPNQDLSLDSWENGGYLTATSTESSLAILLLGYAYVVVAISKENKKWPKDCYRSDSKKF